MATKKSNKGTERLKSNKTLSAARAVPEISDNLNIRGNCNALKMEIGKPSEITEMGARLMSIIATGGHEVIRNLSEPSDQTLMHINVYADFSRTISPHTPSGAIEALLTKVAEK